MAALSNSLLDIPPGALALLGITAGASIGSRIQSANEDLRAGAPRAALDAVARAPRWSDLVVTSRPGEIDVTRAQMLIFTVISAGFVALKLFNSCMIPEVPNGFLLLMGLSNGVYLTAKFVPTA